MKDIAVDTEQLPDGIWSIEILWDDSNPILATKLRSFEDCIRVLNKYRGYSSMKIEVESFTSPDRY